MSDAKETKAEHAAAVKAKAEAAEEPEQMFCCHDHSKPDEPCICLYSSFEDAKKKCPTEKVVDIDPAIWKPKKKTKFTKADPEYATLQWAIDNRGK